jgi:hypothetical protein
VIALFGFLNRWNDTMATPLEDEQSEVGQKYLSRGGWRSESTTAEPTRSLFSFEAWRTFFVERCNAFAPIFRRDSPVVSFDLKRHAIPK